MENEIKFDAYVMAIAKCVHQLNKAYCEMLEDYSQVDWDEAPEWQKESAMTGVQKIMDGEIVNYTDSHKSWMDQKVKNGWVYGNVKDARAKTHPCIVPFEDLPEEQQIKDLLFFKTVNVLLVKMPREKWHMLFDEKTDNAE